MVAPELMGASLTLGCSVDFTDEMCQIHLVVWISKSKEPSKFGVRTAPFNTLPVQYPLSSHSPSLHVLM